jgi:hypothetical protein
MTLLLQILAGLVFAWAAILFVYGFTTLRRKGAAPDERGCAIETMFLAIIVMAFVALCWFFGSWFINWIGSWVETPTLL